MLRSARRLAWAAVAAALAGWASATAGAAGEAVRLAPGGSARAEAAPGAPAAFVVAAEAGRPWVAVVAVPVDVVVTAATASGEIARADSPVTSGIVERLLVEPQAAGEVRLEVALAEDWRAPAAVELTVEDLAGAPAERLEAERAEAEAGAALAGGGAQGWQAAEAAFAVAAEAWQRLGLPGEAARAHLQRAAVLRRASRNPDALAAAEVSAELYRAAGDGRGEGLALNVAGLAQNAIGDTLAARRLFAAAVDLLAGHGDAAAAARVQYLVCLADLRSGALDTGLACVEEAIAVHRASGDLEDLATALTTAGRAYDFLADPDRASALYGEAIALWRRLGDRSGEAKALNNLAFFHAGLGEPRQALAAYERALAVFRELGDVEWEARVVNNLSGTYLRLGDAHRARLLLEEALPLRRRSGNRNGEALTLNLLGRAFHQAGDFAAAERSQRRAAEILGELGEGPELAGVLLDLSRTLRDAGDPAAALAAVDRAAALIDADEHPRHTSRLVLERGLTRLAAGDADAAAADLAAAVDRRRAERDPWGEAEALAALAAAERRQGRLAAAEDHLAASVERIEESRLRVPGPELRATFLGRWRDVYEEWIDVLMERHAAEPSAGHDRRALAASERSRARSLLDLLAEAGADLDRRLDPALGERLDSLRRRLAARSARLLVEVTKEDGAAIAAAEREVYQAVAALEAAEAEARAADPGLAALAPPPLAGAAALAGRLAADELLVEVALGDERSFLWTLAGGRLASFVLPGRAEVEAAARAVHEAASRPGGMGAPEAARAAERLADWLLPPGRVPAGTKRLLVVADGALHYVPFALLPAAPGGEGTGRRPLIEGYEIVSLPSASTLLFDGGRAPAAAGRVAALADPVFDARDHRVTSAPGGAGEGDAPTARDDGGNPLALPRLRQSRREAEAIAALAAEGEALVATDFAADRELVVSGALAGYPVLHFATHGILDAEHPELSGLVLSQVDAAGRPKDGFIRLRDVYGLDLAARLVVLSGCRTALGREVRGEGLVGLTRGFLYAGVEQVVASLWRVEDRAAAELMERFYRALWLDGLAPAAALARAQREVAADPRWSDPFFWSAFVINGASRRPAPSAAAAGGAIGPRVTGRADVEPLREEGSWPVAPTTKERTR